MKIFLQLYQVFAKHDISFSFFLGSILSLSCAPYFNIASCLTITFFANILRNAKNYKSAFILGIGFGFGFFICSMHWITVAINVYYDQFWWAIPFALLGIPFLLSIYFGATSLVAFRYKDYNEYPFYFSLSWILFELLRSRMFTGIPWNLLGYSLMCSEEMSQLGSIAGIFGMSFYVVYLTSALVNFEMNITRQNIASAIFIFLSVLILFCFGRCRLDSNVTNFSNTSVRIIQPSIKQVDKWNKNLFISGLTKHISLSNAESLLGKNFTPDLIIWSEAAIPVIIDNELLEYVAHNALNKYKNAKLIFGCIDQENEAFYSAMYCVDIEGELIFKYHKKHLVPFGEYIPFRSILWMIKKLTHGFEDYTHGKSENNYLLDSDIIRPLICYECIFPHEIIIDKANMMLNITNDAWYKESNGCYQHFHIARLRSIENGVPLIRATNHGISAIIDPLGRIVAKSNLNEYTFIDGFIPQALSQVVVYKTYGDICIFIVILLMYFFKKSIYLLVRI